MRLKLGVRRAGHRIKASAQTSAQTLHIYDASLKTSYLRRGASDIKHQTPDIRYQISDFRLVVYFNLDAAVLATPVSGCIVADRTAVAKADGLHALAVDTAVIL